MSKKVCPICNICFKLKHIHKSSDGTYRCPNYRGHCNATLPAEWFEKTQEGENMRIGIRGEAFNG